MQKTQPLYCWESVFTAPLHSNGSYSIVACVFVEGGMCLPSHCLALNVYSDFIIPAFGCHVTIYVYIYLSINPFTHHYIQPPFVQTHTNTHPSSPLYIHAPTHAAVHLFTNLLTHSPLHQSVHSSSHPYRHLYTYQYVRPSTHPSIRQPIRPRPHAHIQPRATSSTNLHRPAIACVIRAYKMHAYVKKIPLGVSAFFFCTDSEIKATDGLLPDMSRTEFQGKPHVFRRIPNFSSICVYRTYRKLSVL
jgi:hypothetical protein